jgi:alpha-D-ribose 1-methylphosphonate 5-triphosphate diphosphatase
MSLTLRLTFFFLFSHSWLPSLLMLGGSPSGNVSALEIAQNGLLDALSSDYVPVSMLHAAFLLVDQANFSLPDAIATMTATPADMVGLNDRGEIAPGKRADLVRVRMFGPVPKPLAVWREGQRVS